MYMLVLLSTIRQQGVVKVDLYQNHSGIDMSSVNIWPADCNIASDDSASLAFLIHSDLDLNILSHIINKSIVVRFSNGDVVYYADSPKIEHDFFLNRHETEDMLEIDNSFKFLGKAVDREENFNDSTVNVTTDRVLEKWYNSRMDVADKFDKDYNASAFRQMTNKIAYKFKKQKLDLLWYNRYSTDNDDGP